MKEQLEKELEDAKNWRSISDGITAQQYYQGQVDLLERLIKNL